MPDGTRWDGYTTKGAVLAAYPAGYAFFEDEDYETLIHKETKNIRMIPLPYTP